MKRILLIAAAALMGGCANHQGHSVNDFTYTSLQVHNGVGVLASSAQTSAKIEVYAICTEGKVRYSVRKLGSSYYGSTGEKWTPYIKGREFWESAPFYDSKDEFLFVVSTLEMVGPRRVFGKPERIQVANAEMLSIPERCIAMRDKAEEDAALAVRAARIQEEQKINAVANETKVQPMFSARYTHSFNGLVDLIRQKGVDGYKGTFIWPEDGDFRATQVVGRIVFMQSITAPHLFMPIQIITDKQVVEGQAWSQVSNRPLQFMGTTDYTTTLGATRQALLFKEI
ncbi:hypothetical protein [Pseudomonas guariconensis]|uniref:hypothetical protein n=1 Tax=Pseudomonas guariconensis TaxID=1288410 RepID=UPI0018D62CC3|nr:hypothetical protein [Pseudomonas guariconensis]MBH3360475.1 hypothetical protein [Pseudomonas guariconensis]